MLDSVLFKASLKLTKAMDNVADENLPYKIANIVKVHTKGATIGALSGAIPGIGGVIAFLTGAGFIWGMYARINKALGIELSENIIKTLATGIIVNLGASIITPLVAGSVISFIPFAGNIGAIVIIGATVYGATMASGIIYLKIMTHIFEAGEDPSNLSVGALKSISKDIVSSFNADEFMKKAKEEFKQKKDSGEFEEDDDEYKFEDEDCDNDEEEDDDYDDDEEEDDNEDYDDDDDEDDEDEDDEDDDDEDEDDDDDEDDEDDDDDDDDDEDDDDEDDEDDDDEDDEDDDDDDDDDEDDDDDDDEDDDEDDDAK